MGNTKYEKQMKELLQRGTYLCNYRYVSHRVLDLFSHWEVKNFKNSDFLSGTGDIYRKMDMENPLEAPWLFSENCDLGSTKKLRAYNFLFIGKLILFFLLYNFLQLV